MPSASELKDIGRNDLHCKISRTKKYSGWAKDIGLPLKRSETTLGNEFENEVKEFLEENGYNVEKMTTKHPYDLLVEGCVKVDIKVSNPFHSQEGSRWHAFRLAKKYATCDFYVCIALDEQGNKEKTLVIPGHKLKQTMLNVGSKSKYDKYKEYWGQIDSMVRFFKNWLN